MKARKPLKVGKLRQEMLDLIEAGEPKPKGILADCGCPVKSYVAPSYIGQRHYRCHRRWQRVE